MVRVNRLVLTAILSLLLVFVGCGGGGGGGGGDSSKGTAPKINNVTITDGNFNPKSTFRIGDKGNFVASVNDPDLDITGIYVSEFFPSDSETPYSGPSEVVLPSQSAADMDYVLIEPTTITGPVGGWRLEFQVEDAQGNMSNIFRTYVVIN